MNKIATFLKPSFLRNGKQIITQRNFTRAPFSSLSNLGKRPGPGVAFTSNVNFSTTIFSKNLMFGDGNQRRGYASMSFEDAVQKSKYMKDSDNSTKLKVYGLYKQATVGKANGKRPGAFDFVGQAKFDAWSGLGDMTQEEAKKQYIELVGSNLDDAGASSEAVGQSESTASGVEGLDITIENGIRTILKNRPTKFNALTREMYEGIARALKEANDDPNTNVIVITGSGSYYCSGNDLSNFTIAGDPAKMAKEARDILERYVDAYIYCKKPIVAIINGPAVGISVTVLGLCDLVLSSDQATFSSPFSALGQSPEGCSTYTFPRIMGYAKASDLLFFNQKITAAEAEKVGLVTAIYPHDSLQEKAGKRVKEIAQLPVKSLVYSKELVRGRERDLLHQVNVAECDRLLERFVSEDCMNAIKKFLMRKSKV